MRGVLRLLANAGLEPVTVIDVGVAHGTYELYDAFPQANHLLVEPMVEFQPALEMICAHRRRQYALTAVGATTGSISIHFDSRPDGASTVVPFPNTRAVPVEPLDALVASRGLPGPYLLKVDVQGAERDVLAGASAVLDGTDAVLIESSFYDFAGNMVFAELVRWMDERGFAVFEIYDVMTLANGAMAQADVAFVRKDHPIRHDPVWLSPEADARREKLGRIRAALGL